MAEENVSPSLQQQIQGLIKATADGLELKTEKQLQSIVLSVETINQKLSQVVPAKDFEVVGQLKKDLEEVNTNLKKYSEHFDNFIARENKRSVIERKDFESTWKAAVEEKLSSISQEEMTKMTKQRDFKLSFEMKVGTMTLSNITGDQQAAYSNLTGWVPPQRTNMRDYLRTVNSPTGLFITFRETGSTGSISKQTEGSSKTQIDYSMTEIKAVSGYISGYARVSKQLMYALPVLQNQIAPLLLRDFYKKENDYLFTTIASNSIGNQTTTGLTVDAEEIIRCIANQRQANFNADIGFIDHTEWSRLMLTKPNDYGVPGGVVIDRDGVMTVGGMPIVPAAWAQTDHILIIDRDFYERVETESLRVEFSYEDQDNFIKNLVTIRVECFEELNRLRDDASIYHDFGNS